MHWYIDKVVAASTKYIPVRRSLLRVFTMLEEPQTLFRPAVLSRSLYNAVIGSGASTRDAAPAETGALQQRTVQAPN